MPLAEILGEFVSKIRYDDIPREVRDAVKPRFLDWIGAALYGHTIRYHQPLFDVLKGRGGSAEATVIGEGVKIPVTYASSVNSAMSFTSPDIERFGAVHISSVIMPVALAMAEWKGAEGKDFIAAVILGYDIATRIGRALYPSDFQRGFHPTPIAGALGAAAAATKILGLDREKTSHALSVAATFSSGLLDAYGSMESALVQIGRASESGILSAMLANGGVKGSRNVLEGGFLSRGFLGAYSDNPIPDKVTERLGENYLILRNTIKMYGGCRHNHASIDAVMEILEKHKIKKEEIEEIRVKTYKLAAETQVEEPRNEIDLEFHLPYSISVGILENRAIMADTFKMERFRAEVVQDLIRRIRIEHDPLMDKDFPNRWPAEATLKTKDGKLFSHSVDIPKGEPEWPFSGSEIDFKFRYLAGKSIENSKIDKIISVVNDLEKIVDFSQLMLLLRPS